MRKIGIRFRCFEIGFRLYQLLIDLGRIDIGKKFSPTNAGADISIPFFQVAVGSRVNRRFDISLHRTRKHESLVSRFRDRMNDGNGGNGTRLSFFGEGLVLRAALNQGECSEHDQGDHGENKDSEKSAFAWPGLTVDFRCHKSCTFPYLLILPQKRFFRPSRQNDACGVPAVCE